MIILKILKSVIGVYLALTTVFLAFIGVGTIFKRVSEHPEEGCFETAGKVLQEASNNIRN